MNIVVPIKLVPDLVEELSIDESGVALDTTWMRMIINEFDDHAIEQAILLKEQGSGHVTVIAPEIEGVDDVLYTAAAKGADRLIKLTGNFEEFLFFTQFVLDLANVGNVLTGIDKALLFIVVIQ